MLWFRGGYEPGKGLYSFQKRWLLAFGAIKSLLRTRIHAVNCHKVHAL